MKAKLNDAQARAYIAGDQREPAQELAMSKTISAQKTGRS